MHVKCSLKTYLLILLLALNVNSYSEMVSHQQCLSETVFSIIINCYFLPYEKITQQKKKQKK